MKSTQSLIDHLYPSDKASQLFISGNELVVRTNGSFKEGEKPQHLYLCSTQFAKNGEWCFYKNNLGGSAICKAKDTPYGRVYQVEGTDYGHPTGGITPLKDEIFKIEFTTDSKLTKCGCGLSGKWVDHEDRMYQEHKLGCETKSFVGVGAIDMNTKARILDTKVSFPKSISIYTEVNFLEEYSKRYNQKEKFDVPNRTDKELIGMIRGKDNQKGVDVWKLAEKILRQDFLLNFDWDKGMFMAYKERVLNAMKEMYNQALQSNAAVFSLEDMKLAINKSYDEGLVKYSDKGIARTRKLFIKELIESLTKKQNDPYPDGGRCQREEEDETRCEKRCDHCIEYYKPLDKEQDEYMKEYPPFGGPYPEKEPKGNVMIECEMENKRIFLHHSQDLMKIPVYKDNWIIKLDSNGQPILTFK